jgi:hypothetical protein
VVILATGQGDEQSDPGEEPLRIDHANGAGFERTEAVMEPWQARIRRTMKKLRDG